MKLYIANITKQRHDFAWRKPETGRLVYHPINAGSQAVVIDGTRAEIDLIIQQHADYGLIDATKIDQNRIYIGLCYSIDKPVSSKVIEKAMRDNDGHLNRAAHDRRQASVLATNNALTEQENGYLGELEVSAEQRLNATDDRDETAFVDETLAVNTGTKKKK
ncbi:hypothetical protein LWN82_003650 [Salmonella enterica]|nr:hypothetical protein [Salmonella enterica]EIR2478135.1 hypothetical protein [Salmonella enterica]